MRFDMATPVGEESWLAYLDEAVRNATDLEKRVHAIELYKRAVSLEPGSLRLWLAYCDFFWALWSESQDSSSGWSEEERMMGRELFSFGAALALWQRGYESIKYRISDSHELWNRWISHEMGLLSKTRTPDGIKRITHLYRNRLVTPHLAWEETSQAFSSFLSEYNRNAWEDTMKEATGQAQETKRLIADRDPFEIRLRQAQKAQKVELEKSIMEEYLEWEMLQSKRNNDHPDIGIDLCCGLFDRALTGVFATDETMWNESVVFLSSSKLNSTAVSNLLDVLERAVKHCPWSGKMWNKYILCAEEANLSFTEIERIKHAATSEDQLYKAGMESMIEMYVAWCGFLKRRAVEAGAGDEAVDVADVGLPAALENVAVVGNRLYGKDFQGDPKFRLERIYIQYLTEKKGATDEARAQWNKLASVPIHADSHDFWFRYYMWEMLIFSSKPASTRSPTPLSNANGLRVPTLATSVLARAVARTNIDWPEKVLEVYVQHCNDYEPPASMRRATDRAYKAAKEIRRRREREQQEKDEAYAAYYAQQPQQQKQEETLVPAEAPASETKRKRDDIIAEGEASAKSCKRQKNEDNPTTTLTAGQEQPAPAKRDREHTTVLVEGLPADVTQVKLRQYFKPYGHINNVTALVQESDQSTSTALIEFKTTEEAQSALLRDGKYFGQSQLRVTSGHDLTLYLANFPPAADENFIRDLFKDCGTILSIRWPSLKVNTHRRFCYVSFRDRDATAKATSMDGSLLEDKYRLVAKFSDPGQKKRREGALAEGREVHIQNLDRFAPESELRQVFGKYGTVLRVNVPTTLAGKNKGFAFIDFETKEQAEKAVAELNNTKFRSQILQVDLSKDSKIRSSAKIVNAERQSASPAPSSAKDAEGDHAMGDAQPANKPTLDEIKTRTISLMGLPDTVNDARVRALVEPHGAIVQMTLQPAHGGAKIEFSDAATAGKAALQLDGMEFEGFKLRTGSVEELRHAKPPHKEDKITYGGNKDTKTQKPKDSSDAPKTIMPPPTVVRRPGAQKTGPKRKIGFAGVRPQTEAGSSGATNGKPAPKSNADFKAMYLASSGGKETDKKDKGEESAGAENGVEG